MTFFATELINLNFIKTTLTLIIAYHQVQLLLLGKSIFNLTADLVKGLLHTHFFLRLLSFHKEAYGKNGRKNVMPSACCIVFKTQLTPRMAKMAKI